MPGEIDVLIIGGGAAGLAAGLYCARARLDTVLIERMGAGGQLINVDRVENYPGFPDSIAGHELGPLFSQQALDAGLRFEYGEVQRLTPFGAGDRHLVETGETDANSFAARAVILACGSTLARLGVAGEAEFEGRGVSYCATCDGEFCRDQPVAVVGGGDSAIDEALYLTGIASHVTVIHRRNSFRAEQLGRERLLGQTNLSVVWDTEPIEITGQEAVDGVQLRSVKDGTISRLDVAGVFIYTGLRPNTGFLQGLVALDPAGHVITDQRLESSAKGIFAAGDLRQFSARQVAASVGDGVTAAIWAERYLRGPLAR